MDEHLDTLIASPLHDRVSSHGAEHCSQFRGEGAALLVAGYADFLSQDLADGHTAHALSWSARSVRP